MKKTVTGTFSVSAVKDGAKGDKGDTPPMYSLEASSGNNDIGNDSHIACNGQILQTTGARGHTCYFITGGTNPVVAFSRNYDTYGTPSLATDLANFLTGDEAADYANGVLVIIGYDAISVNDDLRQALRSYGYGGENLLYNVTQIRESFVFIGQKGMTEGTAYYKMSKNTKVSLTASVSNGVLIGMGHKGEKGEKGDKGDTGSTGPVMYNAGAWSSNTQYTNNGKATPMVMTESSSGGITSRNYWYLPNVGSSTNQDPRNGAPWEEVPGYAALFAEMAIINGGTLNDAVFKDGWMFSKAGRYMSNESYVYTTYNDTNWTNFDPTVYNSSDEALWRPLVAIDFRNGKAYYTDSINATGGEFNGNFSAYRNRIIIGKIQAQPYADSDMYGARFSDSHETECGSIVQYTDSGVSQCTLTLTANEYSSSSPQEIGRLDIVPTAGIAHTALGSFSLLQNWSIGKYGDCIGLKSTTRVFPSYFSDDSFDMTSEESGTFYVFDNNHDLTINLPEESLDGFTFELKAINHPINLKVKNNSHSIVFQDEAQSNRKEQRIEDSVPRKYIYVQGRWFEMSYHH